MPNIILDGQKWEIIELHKHPANVQGLTNKLIKYRMWRLKKKNIPITIESLFRRAQKTCVLLNGVEYRVSELVRHPANIHKMDYMNIWHRIYALRKRNEAIAQELLFAPVLKPGPKVPRKASVQKAKKTFTPKIKKPGSWLGIATAVKEASHDLG